MIDPIHLAVDTREQVRDRVLEAAVYIRPAQLGTTDDCGFPPFAADVSTSREISFEKIRVRVMGTPSSCGRSGSERASSLAGGKKPVPRDPVLPEEEGQHGHGGEEIAQQDRPPRQ